MASTTKARIIEETTHLFTSQGYTGTGLKQIATQAGAPFGSIYHFFPGGKRDLAATVLRESGTAYGLLVPLVYDASEDVVTGTANFFAGAAQHLVDTDWADACPIGTVALEVASTDDELRTVIADVFDGWLQLLDERLVAAGITAERARELSHTVLAALEGGFMLCRTLRTTRPLLDAGAAMAALVTDALPPPTLGSRSDQTGHSNHRRRHAMTITHPDTTSQTGTARAPDLARTRLWWSAVVFLVAFSIHTADHLRRGAESISSALYVAGTISSAITVAGITIVLTRHRLAPAVAVAVGFPQALAFLAAHFLPHWSSLSDSFVDEHVIWFSWFAASAEVLGATLFGVAGLLVLRRDGLASIRPG